MRNAIFLLLTLLLACQTKKTTLKLPTIFADGMVLQQSDAVKVWGWGTPETDVIVSGSWGQQASVAVDASGNWTASIQTAEAGGPFTLTIQSGDTTVSLEDIWLGEVWLASGQSNMEMSLRGWPPTDTINYSDQEIAEADYPQIRMFTVEKNIAEKEKEDLNGVWQVCSPANAGGMSATAYFFARKLHKTLNVPVGIIHTSWGGTPAEAWVSRGSLEQLGDFNDALSKLTLSEEEEKALAVWTSKLTPVDVSRDGLAGVDTQDAEAASPDLDDSGWDEMALPTAWERVQAIGEFDGVMWFRKTIELESAPNGTATLNLGPIDDMDVTYVNGTEVGKVLEGGKWQLHRSYEIPEGVLKAGKNVIAVKVLDAQGGGGIYGSPEQMQLTVGGKALPLAGDWKYLPTGDYRSGILYLMGVRNPLFKERPATIKSMSQNSPSVLYNAMLAPIIDYGFKGAIWYQGESNVGRHMQYEKLFPALITDWRTRTGREFPFYFVQIAPWKYSDANGISSAALRDAQRKTLSLPKTGMAVTLDIGNFTNIHPGNKQDVGKRLALWALANTYGQGNPFSGPLPSQFNFSGNKALITFQHAEGLKFTTPTGFEVAGADKVYYPAAAEVNGTIVTAYSAQVSAPQYVRYAWKDLAEPTLFNEAGLPASSFSNE